VEKIKRDIPNLVPYSGKYVDPPEGDYVKYVGPGVVQVPDKVVIGYIEGDGIGPEVVYAAIKVANAAVEKAYGKSKRVIWYEVVVGEKAEKIFGNRLPDQRVEVLKRIRFHSQAPVKPLPALLHPFCNRQKLRLSWSVLLYFYPIELYLPVKVGKVYAYYLCHLLYVSVVFPELFLYKEFFKFLLCGSQVLLFKELS